MWQNAKPISNALQQKLGKACHCSQTQTLPKGRHKDNLNFKPYKLRIILQTLAVDLASIGKQLQVRTSLDPMQRGAALNHAFGPAWPSHASSWFRGSLFLRLRRVRHGYGRSYGRCYGRDQFRPFVLKWGSGRSQAAFSEGTLQPTLLCSKISLQILSLFTVVAPSQCRSCRYLR